MPIWTDEKIDRVITRAAEDAAGFYYEKTKHDIGLVLEALEGMKWQVDNIPIIEEKVDGLTLDMQVMKGVLKDTNKDLQSHDKRITKLETVVFHG